MLIKSAINIVISLGILLGLIYLFDLDTRVLCIGFVTGYVLCLVRSLFDD